MRSLHLILFFAYVLLSCNNQNESYKSPLRSESELFKEAAGLKGLSEFVICETTTIDLKTVNKKINEDTRYLIYANEFKLDEKKSSCPDIRVYEISEYYIGDIKISYLELRFYRDTLFQIDSWASDDIKKAFNLKYGEGIRNYKYSRIFPNKKSEKMDVFEDITWQNEKIKAHYHDEIHSKGIRVIGRTDYFTITTKTTIANRAAECLSDAYDMSKKEEEAKRKKSLDQF